MKKVILFGLVLMIGLSCYQEDDFIAQENGKVWLSGGLAICAEQIHLDSGDTLIVNLEDIISFKIGDRVRVKYKEIGLNELCSPGIGCQIIDIRKID
jgi:hypothetical protein